jgi:hypothetical protein
VVAERVKCSETTRAGNPCGAWPVAGETKCAGHLGIRPLDAREGNAASARARRVKAELRRRSALDWAAAKLEEHGEEIANMILAAARGGDWRAAAFLYERVYGKPQERVEMTGTADKDLREMTPEQRAELRRRALARLSDAAELVPRGENAKTNHSSSGWGAE